MENVNEWKNFYSPSIYNVSGKQSLSSLIEQGSSIDKCVCFAGKRTMELSFTEGGLYISERKI